MSEVQSRPGGTMSMERRYGIAISVALILGGAYWAMTGLTEDSKTSKDTYPVQGTVLTIDSGSADLELRSGDVREITVDRKFSRNMFGSDPAEKYEDGKLEIRDTGCGFLSFGCDTDYVVTIPKDLNVTVGSSSGDLQVSDLPGGATLKTTSGNIEAHKIGGALTMNSSSGDLEGSDLDASSVTTESSSGSLELTFLSAPSSVQAETSSGDVTVVLPTGTETYKVDTDTSSGDESTEVKMDPASTRTITAKTSSGDVTVEYAD
jgi:DUF4097 and DUF4098 domain-containing protein YvlB